MTLELSYGLLQPTPGRQVHKQLNSLRMSVMELTPDKGVVKETIKPGDGRPIEAGDILAVQYSAKVKGQDKPFAKGDKEQFIFKDGSMIKGWDIGVGSMKVGETSKIVCSSPYAYGDKGIGNIIPGNSDVELEIKVLAWLGNQLRPESLFSKDLDIDPFIASTPESIQAEYDEMQSKKEDKYKGSIVDIYLRRLKNISFGFGGGNFFASQSGEKAPWYLNPNLTFPAIALLVIAGFGIVFGSGGVRQKGASKADLEFSRVFDQVSTDSERLAWSDVQNNDNLFS